MEPMKQAINALIDQCATLPELVDALCGVLRTHPDELKGIHYSYRLAATDTGFSRSFALVDGQFSELSDADAVDVTVQGAADDLLRVFRRQLSPVGAMLRGKLKVQGNKAALMRLGEFV